MGKHRPHDCVEGVVHIVGNTPGEATDGLHFFGLYEFCFNVFALVDELPKFIGGITDEPGDDGG